MTDDDVSETGSHRRSMERIDAISIVAGLLFVAIAVLALADRFWADIDAVVVVGGAIVAIGVAMIAGLLRRGWRGEQPGS